MPLIKKTSLRPISRDEALDLIEEIQAAVHHVDPLVDRYVTEARQLYRVRLFDNERFLSLIMPSLDEAYFLTPDDEPRTLKDVAQRLLKIGHTFEQLAEDVGFPPEDHQPVWFAKTCYLDEHFDFERFGLLVLSYAEPEEQEQSPTGTFYICDGVHRCMVLARKLLAGEIRYQALEAILIIPRAIFSHHYDPRTSDWWKSEIQTDQD